MLGAGVVLGLGGAGGTLGAVAEAAGGGGGGERAFTGGLRGLSRSRFLSLSQSRSRP